MIAALAVAVVLGDEVFREAPDVFFYRIVPAKLHFSRGADGAVDGLTLEQGGRELKGKRSASTQ